MFSASAQFVREACMAVCICDFFLGTRYRLQNSFAGCRVLSYGRFDDFLQGGGAERNVHQGLESTHQSEQKQQKLFASNMFGPT